MEEEKNEEDAMKEHIMHLQVRHLYSPLLNKGISPPTPSRAWNCWERGFAPPGAARRSAQRGNVPL
jgi:hypothetical protein